MQYLLFVYFFFQHCNNIAKLNAEQIFQIQQTYSNVVDARGFAENYVRTFLNQFEQLINLDTANNQGITENGFTHREQHIQKQRLSPVGAVVQSSEDDTHNDTLSSCGSGATGGCDIDTSDRILCNNIVSEAWTSTSSVTGSVTSSCTTNSGATDIPQTNLPATSSSTSPSSSFIKESFRKIRSTVNRPFKSLFKQHSAEMDLTAWSLDSNSITTMINENGPGVKRYHRHSRNGEKRMTKLLVECRKEGVVWQLIADDRENTRWKRCRLVLMKTTGGDMLEFYSPPKVSSNTF